MRWVGHVVLMGKRETNTGFWWGKVSERDHLGDNGICGRIILKVDLQEVENEVHELNRTGSE